MEESRAITATKTVLSAVEKSAVIGYFILHDGIGFDDIKKILDALPEFTDIGVAAANTQAAFEEVKTLNFREALALVRDTTFAIERVIDAIIRIQETGTYKQVRAAKAA